MMDLAEPEWAVSRSGLVVPAASRSPRQVYERPVGVDLFAGAGGFSAGMHQGGFHMAAAVENDIPAALTYMVNLARPGVQIYTDEDEIRDKFGVAAEKHLGLRPPGNGDICSASAPRPVGKVIEPGLRAGEGWIAGQPDDERGCEHFFLCDVRNVTGEMILEALDLDQGEVDAVVGGPPCQGFSTAGKRNVMDPRNSLVFEFVRLVLEIRPKAMCMENVPNLLNMVTPEGLPVIDALCRILEDGGFSSYDAMKRSLLASAGVDAGAALRRKSDPRKSKQRGKTPAGDDGDGLFNMDEVTR